MIFPTLLSVGKEKKPREDKGFLDMVIGLVESGGPRIFFCSFLGAMGSLSSSREFFLLWLIWLLSLGELASLLWSDGFSSLSNAKFCVFCRRRFSTGAISFFAGKHLILNT
jgi:hypothetical protein